MANTYLTRTPSTTGNTKKFTISFWVKRSVLGTEQDIFHAYPGSGSRSQILFNSANQLKLDLENNTNNLITNRLFRDTSAWYHIVIVYDSDNSTSSDRLKIYVNGVRETSFATAQYPSSGSTSQINTTTQHEISSYDGAGYYFEGSMSHIHFIDGTVYDATAFGEYDANGVWKIKTSPSVTYGTNGFFILKDGNSVTDQSGNSNNWTVAGGTLTNTEDNPSNVFATFNPLIYNSNPCTFSNGNTRVVAGTAEWRQQGCTIGIAEGDGKYYWEMKGVTGADFNGLVGIKDVYYANIGNFNFPLGYGSSGGYGIAYGKGGELYENAVPATSSWGDTYAVGDVISVAFDADNMKIYFAKNGVWQNSGVPTSGATGTGAINVVSAGNGENVYLPFVTAHAGGWDCNFGNGYFGTTTVSSAGTNASGIGIFEYDVPTGYTALSTKGLNL
jgi:hypothetical protein